MEIIFTVEAKRDLDELREYLIPLSPSGLANVTAAIEQRLLLIAVHPRSGRPSPRAGVREAIEPRYGFLMPYWIGGKSIHILRIYRSQRAPLDYGKMRLLD